MRRLLPCLVLLLLGTSTADSADLPPETAARLAAALESLESSPAVAGYTMTVKATVAKPNGADREDSVEVVKATRGLDGKLVHEVVKAIENGKDITEKRRAESEKRRAKEAEKDKGDEKKEASVSASLKLPIGDDAALFAFSPTPSSGPYSLAFAPLPAHGKDDGLAHGALAWDGATLDPLWLEAEPVVLPDHVSAMKLRFEFARTGALLYPRRTVTDGAGGLLWIKRTFHVEMEITDVVPATPAPRP